MSFTHQIHKVRSKPDYVFIETTPQQLQTYDDVAVVVYRKFIVSFHIMLNNAGKATQLVLFTTHKPCRIFVGTQDQIKQLSRALRGEDIERGRS